MEDEEKPWGVGKAGVDRREFIRGVSAGLAGAGIGLIGLRKPAWGAAKVDGREFTEWGWPLPYRKISDQSISFLKSKGWWPLKFSWNPFWSGHNTRGVVIVQKRLLEARGLEIGEFTADTASQFLEAYFPGRIQVASWGALGMGNIVDRRHPSKQIWTEAPNTRHSFFVPINSPLKSLDDLKDQKVLGRPAVAGVTFGSTAHYVFVNAARVHGLTENKDFILKSTPPPELVAMPAGIDISTIWEPPLSMATVQRKTARVLAPSWPYMMFSGSQVIREEIIKGAPDVAQALSDANVEADLWIRTYPDEANKLMAAHPRLQGFPFTILEELTRSHVLYYKPTAFYPFNDVNGLWPKENVAVLKWVHAAGYLTRAISEQDWAAYTDTSFMDGSYQHVGWAIPKNPPWIPDGWTGRIGSYPYPEYITPYNLKEAQAFPTKGDLTKSWYFKGKVYRA
jgi:sulfonate transport system substrate-binding protein